MKKFTIRLNNVKDSYYSFVVAVLTYVKNKPSRLPIVEKFLDEHSDASTSDILEFISDQPDFYEDAAYNQPEVSCHGFQTSGRESSSTATSSNERKKRRIKDMAGKYDFDEEIIESLRMKSLI